MPKAGLHLSEPAPLAEVLATIIEPTYANVLPGRFNSAQATVMLLAIGLQESKFQHRQQIGGPAKGFWQFEQGGGTRGVIEHPSTERYALAAAHAADVGPLAASEDGLSLNTLATFRLFETSDLLACAFARLLLFTDPAPLPALGDSKAAWDYYARNWRPGKPHPKAWDAHYKAALGAMQ